MRKYVATAALLSLLALAGCGGSDSEGASKAECDALSDNWSSALDDFADLTVDAEPALANDLLDIGRKTVASGRQIYSICSDFLPTSFSSAVDEVEEGMDVLEDAL